MQQNISLTYSLRIMKSSTLFTVKKGCMIQQFFYKLTDDTLAMYFRRDASLKMSDNVIIKLTADSLIIKRISDYVIDHYYKKQKN
jgi:hypothetical protein